MRGFTVHAKMKISCKPAKEEKKDFSRVKNDFLLQVRG